MGQRVEQWTMFVMGCWGLLHYAALRMSKSAQSACEWVPKYTEYCGLGECWTLYGTGVARPGAEHYLWFPSQMTQHMTLARIRAIYGCVDCEVWPSAYAITAMLISWGEFINAHPAFDEAHWICIYIYEYVYIPTYSIYIGLCVDKYKLSLRPLVLTNITIIIIHGIIAHIPVARCCKCVSCLPNDESESSSTIEGRRRT